MAENKTKPTAESVEDYLASRANVQQRADCKTLMALFKKDYRETTEDVGAKHRWVRLLSVHV